MAGPLIPAGKMLATQVMRSGTRVAGKAATKGAAQTASKGAGQAGTKALTKTTTQALNGAVKNSGQITAKRFPTQVARMPQTSATQVPRKIPLQSRLNTEALLKNGHKALDFANKYGVTDIAADTAIAYAHQKHPDSASITEGFVETARTANNLHYEEHHPDQPTSAVKPIVSGMAGSALASTIIRMQELTARPAATSTDEGAKQG